MFSKNRNLNLFSLVLTIVIIVVSACGCGKNQENTNENSMEMPSGKADISESTEQFFTELNTFNENLAFVKTDNEFFCIDKKGKTVFTLKKAYTPLTDFNNGVALLEDESNESFICDKKGNLTPITSCGATSLLKTDYLSQMLKDDIIPVIKETTGFSGSSAELGILNSKGEMTVPFSSDLFDKYSNGYTTNGAWYYNGYMIFARDNSFNLRTGEIKENLSDLPLKNRSDFWTLDSDGIVYDDRYSRYSQNAILNLSQYAGSLYSSRFRNGVCGIIFNVRSAVNNNISLYFTVIDESGNFLFEPVNLNCSSAKFQQDGDTFLISGKANTTSVFVAFDKNGKTGEYSTNINDLCSLYLSDGVIEFNNFSTSSELHTYYDMSFKELF